MAACDPENAETPPNGGGRRRRSWFTPGKPVKIELAVQPESPPEPQPDINMNHVEVLTLSHFTRAPKLDFGTLRPGQSAVRYIKAQNPHDYEQNVVVEKFPYKKNFFLSHSEFAVGGGEELLVTITWNPTEVGHSREMVLFKVDGVFRLQAVLMGKLEEPPKPKKVRKTWAQKPSVPVRPVLRLSNKVNSHQTQAPLTQTKPRKSKSPPAKGVSKRFRQGPAKLKTPPRKSKTPPLTSVGMNYINPQAPVNAVSLMFEKRTLPPGPVDSPVDPRRTTFEKSSPEMHNTPVISVKTPPQSMREKSIQPRRILGQRTPSPLAAVKENMAPLMFCDDENSPRPVRAKSKMRRSNTYTKLDDSSSSPNVADLLSPECSETSDADTTVIEKTEITEIVEVTECTEVKEYTEVCEEIIEMEEKIEYLIEGDPENGGTHTEVGRSVKPLGRHLYSVRESDLQYNTTYHTHQQAFDATRVISGNGDLSYNDSRMSMPPPPHDDSRMSIVGPPHSATFVKSPHGAVGVLSETRVLSPHAPRMSDIRESLPLASGNHMMSETRVLTPKPASPRRFFSDLLALHDGNQENQRSFEKLSAGTTDKSGFPVMKTPDERRVSSLTVTKDKPASSHTDESFNSRKGLFENQDQDVNPRRFSTLTVTKNRQKNCFSPIPNTVDPRRISSLTVTKSVPSSPESSTKGNSLLSSPSREAGENLFNSRKELFENPDQDLNPRRFSTLTVTKDRESNRFAPIPNTFDPRRVSSLTVTKSVPSSPEVSAREGRCLFSPPSRQTRHTPDSPGVRPLANSPSPNRSTPPKIAIYGTNFPNSRSPRNMDDENWMQSPSPRKTTPRRERTRRRTSGQFRRRSSTYQANGSLVARGLTPKKLEDDDSEIRDSPMSRSELSNDSSNKSGHLDSSHSPQVLSMEIPVVPLPTQIQPAQAKVTRKPAPLPSYARPTSATNRKNPLTANNKAYKKENPMAKPDKTEKSINLSREDLKGAFRGRKPVKPEAAAKKPPLVANYLRPTSAVQRRKEAVTESKKRDLSADNRKPGKPEQGPGRDEPATKRTKREVTSQTVVASLTKTQALRREAALAGMDKPQKKAAPRPKPKVAQGKLRLVKATTKTALPKHPMAFAAKNIYYDERWMEKQDRGFVRWLNFILTPHEEECNGPTKPQKVDAGALSVAQNQSGPQLAPSKETLSFRVYSARRRLNRLRRKACKLFTEDEMVRFHHKLEVEVECQRIVVRSDRKIHADVGIKQRILDLLLCYNPLWLRIGLETVYGEILPITSNSDIIGISRFILTRLLANPDIAEEYAHPSVPHLYRDGYDRRLAQFTLKHFLLLVVFLDKAKTSRLIDHDPCLFCRDSDHKASRDLLLIFSRDYLSGEGDLSRHLAYMGYTVRHVQTPLDELDYAVTNLATDLRDGTRLTRMMALLTERWTLTNELRVPAISRLQKIHNIGISFRILHDMGLELSTVKGGKIDPRDISDGHREKTLHLLWQIIFKFQVDLLLDEGQLRQEIGFLKANLHIQKKLDAVFNDDIESLGIPEDRRESMETDLYFKSPRLSLLLTWCRAVCAYYGVKVENFTVSFSDGRVLCLLIHHYHPGLLPLCDINNDTTQTMGPGEHNTSAGSESDDSFTGVWATSFSPSTGKPALWDQLLANERDNFRILYERVNELGNIPVMIRSSDMSNTIPDEKVVITYVTYLCARLLDIRHETRAARIIQVAWRRYRLKKQENILQVRCEAAAKIQRVVRRFLAKQRLMRREAAAICIQAALRGTLARRRTARLRFERHMASKMAAVVKIQAYVRTWLVQRSLARQSAAALQIQAWWRMKSCEREFDRMRYAAIIIQQQYRAYKVGQCEEAKYLKLKAATVLIQSCIRTWLVKETIKQKISAAVKIQSWWKMKRSQRQYIVQKEAVVLIQQKFRACVEGRRLRAQFLELKAAAIILQRAFTARKIRKVHAQHEAATIIQKHWKTYVASKKYGETRSSIVAIQRWYRAKQLRQKYCKLQRAATCIQSYVRSWLVQRTHKQQVSAAITLQSWWRMASARKVYLDQIQAAVTIQRAFRSHKIAKLEKENYLCMRNAAITLQKHWRSHVTRKSYKKTVLAVLRIQTWFRACQQRKKYCQIQGATVCIQTHVRAWMVRKALQRQVQAAVKIQSWWHMVTVQRLFVIQRVAAITIQEHFRAYRLAKIQQTEYQHQKTAATTIQKNWRSYFAVKQYQERRLATVTIQQWYLANQQRKQYCKLREAAICIQAHCRSWSVRQTLKHKTSAAVIIQSWWRMAVARHMYITQLQAVIRLQQQFRACSKARQEQERYLALRAAAITLQRSFRARQTRIAQKQNHAAVVIQTHWRSHVAMKCYNEKRSAVLVLQRCFRAKQQRREYCQLQAAAKCIQAHVRGWSVRRDLQQQSSAAVKVQSWWRMVSKQKAYFAQRQAAIILQEYFRAYRAVKYQKAEYVALKKATIVLQHAFRARRARKAQKEELAATTIQANWRCCLARRKYNKTRQAATMLQRWYRSRQQRNNYCQVKLSVVCIQSHVRAWLAARKERQRYMAIKTATVVIQAAVRGCQQRLKFLNQKQASTRIQAVWRAHKQRTEYLKIKEAAVVIQLHCRAMLKGREERNAYTAKRKSAVTLQAAWRGFCERRDYLKQRQAVIVLQTHARRYILQREYERKRKAAVYIQRWYRAHKLGEHARREYYIIQGATITLQAALRGWLVRRWVKVINNLRRNAITVQAHVRGYLVRKRYLQQRKAAVTIQQHVRAWIHGKRQRYKYHIERGASLAIQKHVRGWLCRRSYKRLQQATIKIQSHYRGAVQRKQFKELKIKHAAATKIQAAFRGHRERRQHLRLRAAVVVIQHYYRARLQIRYARYQFLLKKRSAVRIQTAVRGYIARKTYARQQKAAVCIQSAYRCVVLRRRFLKTKTAASTIQSFFRAHKCKQIERRKFLICKGAAMTIQSAFKGYVARRHMAKCRNAATLIQSTFRAHVARRRFTQMRKAAVVLQACYRSRVLQRCERQKFLHQKAAAITVQSAVRGYLARKTYTRQQKAAVCIQSTYRCVVARRRFLKMKTAASTIQSFFRAHQCKRIERRKFLICKGAAMTIQSAFKGYVARRHMAKCRNAATLIQSTYRAHVAQRRFTRMRKAAVVLQACYRSRVLQRCEQQKFLHQKAAAITVQSAVRGYLARKRITQKHTAATTIQTVVRAWIAKRHFLRLKSTVIHVQRAWRRKVATRRIQHEYQTTRRSAVKIQSIVRGYLARKELAKQHRAATQIQSQFRAFISAKTLLRMRAAAVVLQAHYRKRLLQKKVQKRFLVQKSAAITIQSAVKGYLVRKELRRKTGAATTIQSSFKAFVVRRRFLRIKQASMVIQSRYRAYLSMKKARVTYVKQRTAACVIQAVFRGHLLRKNVRQKCVAATTIQAKVRTWIVRTHYLRLKSSVIFIQRLWRRKLETQRTVLVYHTQRKSAIKIQSYIRGYLIRRKIQRQHTAASKIQTVFRTYSTRKTYLRKLTSIVTIQRYYRAFYMARQQKRIYSETRKSVILIQSCVRRWRVQREIARRQWAATTLQAAYRGYHCRRTYLQLRSEHRCQQQAASVIQRFYRSYRTRKIQHERIERRRVCLLRVTAITRRYVSAVRIQRTFRKYRALKAAEKQVKSVIVIQRWVRARLARIRFIRLRQKIVVVQRAARAYLTRRQASVIKAQSLVRAWLARRRVVRIRRGVTRVQSIWRGYVVRRAVKSVKVKAARRRVEAANANVTEEKKLGNLTTSALDYLLKCQQLSTILDALMKLDKATRWSPTCCERMAESNAAGVIFALIRSCNRSEPHMEIIKYSSEVLLNLTKYEKTSSCVYEAEDSISTLIKLLTIYRDKGCIFTKTCTLLGLLCHQPTRAKEVLAMPQVADKLRSVYALTMRKFKMEEKRNLVKSKMAASKSLSASFMATPQKRLPCIEPEWLLRRQSIRQIDDPVQATKFMMNALQLNPK